MIKKTETSPTHWLGFLIVVCSAFFLGLIDIQPIDNEGDALRKWYYAQLLTVTAVPDIMYDHHALRWGINLPAWGIVSFFGSTALHFLISVTALFAVAVGFFWRSALSFGCVTAALAVFLFVATPSMLAASSTLQPTLFGLVTICGALLFLFHFLKTGSLVYFFLFCCVFFLAYGVKITNLFFLPGLGLYLIARGQWRAVFLMVITFILLIAGETLIYRNITNGDLWAGRIGELLFGNHMNTMTEKEAHADYVPFDLVQRWLITEMRDAPIKLMHLAFFALCLVYPLARKKLFTQDGQRHILDSLVVMGISFSVITTFFVVSLDPLRLGQDLRARYLFVLLPFSTLLISAYAGALLAPLIKRIPVKPTLSACIALILGLVTTLSYIQVRSKIQRGGDDVGYHLMDANTYFSKTIKNELEKGCPVLMNDKKAAMAILIFGYGVSTFSPTYEIYNFNVDGAIDKKGRTIRLETLKLSDLPKQDNWRMKSDTYYKMSYTDINKEKNCNKLLYVGDVDVLAWL